MWPEALPPFIIIATCITVTGIGLSLIDRWQHGGKVSCIPCVGEHYLEYHLILFVFVFI